MIPRSDYPANSTIYIPFASYDANGASVTMTNFAVGDVKIYKNGSTTERSSSNGITLLDTDGTDFDGVTGLHGFSIDLSDNTDAGFYAVGAQYWVVVSTVTISAQTVTFIADRFRIIPAENVTGVRVADMQYISGDDVDGNNAVLNLKQLNISNSTGSAIIANSTGSNGHGISTSGNGTGHGISGTGGSTGTGIRGTGGATSGAGISGNATAGNSIGINGSGQGTAPGINGTAGATGAGIRGVGGATSGEGLLLQTTSGDALKLAPTAGHGINSVANGTDKHGMLLTGGTGGASDGLKAVAGTGGVPIRGDITGNITGNLSGSVGSIPALGAGSISRSTFAADTGLQTIRSNTAQAGSGATITLDTGASAVNDFYKDAIAYVTGGTGAGQFRTIIGYAGATKIATVSPTWATNPDNTSTFAIIPGGLSGLASNTDVANAVWDTTLASHVIAGSTGSALSSASAAGDPWATLLPGSYASGTAGNIVGNRVDQAISSRLAPTTAGRTLDVTATGEAGIDLGNVGNPTATVALPNVTIGTVSTVAAFAAASITASAIAAGALDGKGDWNIGKSGYALSVPGVQAIWDALTANLTTVGSVGKRLADFITGDAFVRLGAPVGASISADIAAKAATGAAMTLTSGERTAVADAMLDEVNGVETGMTVRQTLRGLAAMNFGVVQDAQTGVETFKDPDGTNVRLVIADDSDGNRSSVTRTL